MSYYSDMKDIYKRINKRIQQSIDRKQIDIKELMKNFESGMSEIHISLKYKLNEEELSYILRNYITPTIIKNRQNAIDKLESSGLNLMGRPNKKEDTEVLSIKDAIKLVEGIDEER